MEMITNRKECMMKKCMTLLVFVFGLFLFAPGLFAQDGRDVAGNPEDPTILPYPEDGDGMSKPRDEYYDELKRIRELTLQAYAVEIADEVVATLEQQKIWQDVMKEFLERARFAAGYYPEIREITVPEKDEVVAYVFSTVEELGGLNVAEAQVGIVVDEVAGTLYTALVNLPFTDAQREVLNLPSMEYLTEEQIATNMLYSIKNRAFNHYNAYAYYYPMPYFPLDYGVSDGPLPVEPDGGIGDGALPPKEMGNNASANSPRRSNSTRN
jgi:hypothetical protein